MMNFKSTVPLDALQPMREVAAIVTHATIILLISTPLFWKEETCEVDMPLRTSAWKILGYAELLRMTDLTSLKIGF